MNYVCIWCTREKTEEQFNTEHVLPQSFGTFEQNFTLNHEVCADCNGFFARKLEPWLARDSLEGFDRYLYRQKPPSEFKSQGRLSTTRSQLTEGPYAGAYGFTVPGEEHLGVRPFPQVGFAQQEDGPYEWFPLDALPTKDDLKQRGYEGSFHLRLCECDEAEVTLLLEQSGVKPSFTDFIEPQSGGMMVEMIFRPTLQHRRGLAKIAMNYLAFQYGATVALQSRFDAIRRLVMDGVEPAYKYYGIDPHPIVHGDKQAGRRLFGHALTVRQDAAVVEGVVSLYNRFRHGFVLAGEDGPGLGPRGHFFDIRNRAIISLSLG